MINRNLGLAVIAATFVASAVSADLILLSDPSGLSAEAEFDIVGLNSLQIRLRNTSTGVPGGFDNADQLLTSVSFDLGAFGQVGGDPLITGGSVMTGPTSSSVNFDINVGPNADVSGEYGYGNGGATGLLPNFVTGNQANATAFGGINLDGPANLNGPQGGLIANPALVDLGGLGAIQDEIVILIDLDSVITTLDFLDYGITIEYGSDAAFLTTVPAPSTFALLAMGAIRRRRRA